MKIEVWSDVACPFCYIGKRRLEKALIERGYSTDMIIWRSFQLQPELKNEEGLDLYDHLGKTKGWSREQTIEINKRVIEMAEAEGLSFNLEHAVVANSFDAHRLSQLALVKGVQNKIEELLFRAYFSEGKNIAQKETLLSIAGTAGINMSEAEEVLDTDKYKKEVNKDIEEALLYNIRGVPFFVFNRKFAVSGAQPLEVFMEAISKAESDTI